MMIKTMIKSGFLLSLFIFIGTVYADAQINYGTTGLMNMPTADMQRDKTFMAGGNWLNHHATVPRWWYDTWNYYINITIFPWLEAGTYVWGIRQYPRTMVIVRAIGFLLRMVNLLIRTVPFIFGLECGKKAGGKNGPPR